MNINGTWYEEPEAQAYINSLLARNEELERKHELECMQIAHYSDELAKAKELLARVPAWISIKNKLPEEDECVVLVWIENGKADGIHYVNCLALAYWVKNGSAFVDTDWNEITGITHWMYPATIPEPTKDGERNG